MLRVDEIVYGNRPGWPQRPHSWGWCHLTADNEAELHAAARALGLVRVEGVTFWRDPRPHYVLTPGQRLSAIRGLSAVEVTNDEMPGVAA